MKDGCTYYVAPNGGDDQPGTEERPLKSLNEAIARSRTCREGASKTIILREGSYYDVALRLDARDAMLAIEAYPSETPVLYGGTLVSEWGRDGDWLTAPVPGALDRSRDFRMIEVEGASRERARLPETGAFKHLNVFGVEWLSTFAGGWARKPTDEEMTTLTVKEDDAGDWLDTNNAELTIYHEWDESLVGVHRLEQDAVVGRTRLRLSNRPGHPPGAFAERNRNAQTYVLWNVKEGMKRPGQWFLDRTDGRLVYWPLPGEQADGLHVVVPSRTHLIELAAGSNRISFKGLTFACSAAPLSDGGFGALHAAAAIVGEDVERIVFDGVTVRNTSGGAFKLAGCDIALTGCHIHHTGAGAIQWNGERITLEKSRIHHVGLAYTSAIAVNSEGRCNVIAHNEIHDTPYSGIASVSPNTLIRGNILFDTMAFMKDGAAIYIAWHSDEVTVSGNAVFSRQAERVRRYAYYLDEKCTNCTVSGNAAVNLGVPMLSHMTTGCRFENNLFVDDGPQTVSVMNSFGLSFERNILIAASIDIQSPDGNTARLPSAEYDAHPYMSRYSGADGIVSFANNILFAASGAPPLLKTVLHYKAVREEALEERDGNRIGDPLLNDIRGGDFGFAAHSPAPSRGILPLSFDEAGCTGSFRALLHAYYQAKASDDR